MRCEYCHGTGKISLPPRYFPAIVCGACGGCGFGHCCEGMVGGSQEESAQDASSWGTTNPANWEESAMIEVRAKSAESTKKWEQATLDESTTPVK